MGEDFKSNHFKLVEDVNKDMEDFVVEGFTEPCSKNGESSFTGDAVHRNPGISAISPTSILVPEDLKEMTHILMTVDMTKKVEEE